MLNSLLIGTWVFTGVTQNNPQIQIAPPSPGLVMTFEFKQDGTNNLHYYTKGDALFCKRTAQYKIEDRQLIQKVTKTDPKNGPFCGSDPDMQIDQKTITPIQINEKEILMTIPLGEKKIIYHWKPCNNKIPGQTCEEVAVPPNQQSTF